MTTSRAIVIGAGIGGLSAAIAMRRAGLAVDVFERAPEARVVGTALGIMCNAVNALRSLGIHGELLARGQVVEDFQIRSRRGGLIASMPLKELSDELGAPSLSIHRAALQQVLRGAADGCRFHFGAACEGFDLEQDRVRARFSDGRSAEADILIGADGFNSAVRHQLVDHDPVQYAGYVCWLATVGFEHPRFTRGYVGHYWGYGARFGLVDIGAGQAYWWGTQNCRKNTLDPREAKASATRCFAGWADEIGQVIACTPAAAVLQTDAQDRRFLERWGTGRVTLLGDAAHPMLTSLGQGACMAIEDAVVLGRSVAGSGDLVESLRRYEAARRPRTRKIVRLSRTLSAVEQLENPLTVALRNSYFRLNPRSAVRRQTRPILQFPSSQLSLGADRAS